MLINQKKMEIENYENVRNRNLIQLFKPFSNQSIDFKLSETILESPQRRKNQNSLTYTVSMETVQDNLRNCYDNQPLSPGLFSIGKNSRYLDMHEMGISDSPDKPAISLRLITDESIQDEGCGHGVKQMKKRDDLEILKELEENVQVLDLPIHRSKQKSKELQFDHYDEFYEESSCVKDKSSLANSSKFPQKQFEKQKQNKKSSIIKINNIEYENAGREEQEEQFILNRRATKITGQVTLNKILRMKYLKNHSFRRKKEMSKNCLRENQKDSERPQVFDFNQIKEKEKEKEKQRHFGKIKEKSKSIKNSACQSQNLKVNNFVEDGSDFIEECESNLENSRKKPQSKILNKSRLFSMLESVSSYHQNYNNSKSKPKINQFGKSYSPAKRYFSKKNSRPKEEKALGEDNYTFHKFSNLNGSLLSHCNHGNGSNRKISLFEKQNPKDKRLDQIEVIAVKASLTDRNTYKNRSISSNKRKSRIYSDTKNLVSGKTLASSNHLITEKVLKSTSAHVENCPELPNIGSPKSNEENNCKSREGLSGIVLNCHIGKDRKNQQFFLQQIENLETFGAQDSPKVKAKQAPITTTTNKKIVAWIR